MDLKITAFDAVLYEGASRGIPTTKLHSMYSRKLAAGAAVGAGHSNLYVCALPRDITNDADVPGVSRTDLTRCRVYVPAEVPSEVPWRWPGPSTEPPRNSFDTGPLGPDYKFP